MRFQLSRLVIGSHRLSHRAGIRLSIHGKEIGGFNGYRIGSPDWFDNRCCCSSEPYEEAEEAKIMEMLLWYALGFCSGALFVMGLIAADNERGKRR